MTVHSLLRDEQPPVVDKHGMSRRGFHDAVIRQEQHLHRCRVRLGHQLAETDKRIVRYVIALVGDLLRRQCKPRILGRRHDEDATNIHITVRVLRSVCPTPDDAPEQHNRIVRNFKTVYRICHKQKGPTDLTR